MQELEDVVVGASFNVVDSVSNADGKVVSKIVKDMIADGMVSQTLLRTKDSGIDDIKFLYPIGGVPIVAYSILGVLANGLKPTVVGSRDVGTLCGLISDVTGRDVNFVFEGEDSKLSLSNSILRGASLSGDRFIFLAGDIPFMYDFPEVTDSVVYSHDVHLDFNGQNNMPFKLPRNWYDFVKTDEDVGIFRDMVQVVVNFFNPSKVLDDKKRSRVKEPNVFTFSQEGLKAVKGHIEALYSGRKGGSQFDAAKNAFLDVMREDYAYGGLLMMEAFAYGMKRSAFSLLEKILQKGKVSRPIGMVMDEVVRKHPSFYAMSLKYAERIAEFVLNGNSWRDPYVKVHLQMQHSDPFRVKDIDSIHDWAGYASVMDKIPDDQLNKFFPYAQWLVKLRGAIGSAEISLVRDFPDFIEQKITRLNGRYKEDVQGGKFDGRLQYVPRHLRKKINLYQIPTPFEKDGSVSHRLTIGNVNLPYDHVYNEVKNIENFLKEYRARHNV